MNISLFLSFKDGKKGTVHRKGSRSFHLQQTGNPGEGKRILKCRGGENTNSVCPGRVGELRRKSEDWEKEEGLRNGGEVPIQGEKTVASRGRGKLMCLLPESWLLVANPIGPHENPLYTTLRESGGERRLLRPKETCQ